MAEAVDCPQRGGAISPYVPLRQALVFAFRTARQCPDRSQPIMHGTEYCPICPDQDMDDPVRIPPRRRALHGQCPEHSQRFRRDRTCPACGGGDEGGAPTPADAPSAPADGGGGGRDRPSLEAVVLRPPATWVARAGTPQARAPHRARGAPGIATEGAAPRAPPAHGGWAGDISDQDDVLHMSLAAAEGPAADPGDGFSPPAPRPTPGMEELGPARVSHGLVADAVREFNATLTTLHRSLIGQSDVHALDVR